MNKILLNTLLRLFVVMLFGLAVLSYNDAPKNKSVETAACDFCK